MGYLIYIIINKNMKIYNILKLFILHIACFTLAYLWDNKDCIFYALKLFILVVFSLIGSKITINAVKSVSKTKLPIILFNIITHITFSYLNINLVIHLFIHSMMPMNDMLNPDPSIGRFEDEPYTYRGGQEHREAIEHCRKNFVNAGIPGKKLMIDKATEDIRNATRARDLHFHHIGLIYAICSQRDDESLRGLSNNRPLCRTNSPFIADLFHSPGPKLRVIRELADYKAGLP